MWYASWGYAVNEDTNIWSNVAFACVFIAVMLLIIALLMTGPVMPPEGMQPSVYAFMAIPPVLGIAFILRIVGRIRKDTE